MLRISKIDEELAKLQKPALETVDSLKLQSGDVLVLCAGFEDRALAFLKNIISHHLSQFKVLLINYLPFMNENRGAEIRDICRTANVSCSELTYDRQNPYEFGNSFLDTLGPVHSRLYVDISGMSRLLIVQILVSLWNTVGGFGRTTVLYTEAARYPPDYEEVQGALTKSDVDPLYSIMLLSSGVFDVMVVPELLSISLDGQQTRLIVFPSFNTDQLTALRTELQPSRCSIIHGDPPALENKWRTEAIAKLNHVDNLKGEENFTANTLDYRETLDRLLEIYRVHGATERILIAPTGSKMQAVAVGILRAFVRDVQIVYPTPREFSSPKSYTLGVKNLYLLPLDSFAFADVH
jgi:hypothetical protein